jgi:hypothetical protein
MIFEVSLGDEEISFFIDFISPNDKLCPSE